MVLSKTFEIEINEKEDAKTLNDKFILVVKIIKKQFSNKGLNMGLFFMFALFISVYFMNIEINSLTKRDIQMSVTEKIDKFYSSISKIQLLKVALTVQKEFSVNYNMTTSIIELDDNKYEIKGKKCIMMNDLSSNCEECLITLNKNNYSISECNILFRKNIDTPTNTIQSNLKLKSHNLENIIADDIHNTVLRNYTLKTTSELYLIALGLADLFSNNYNMNTIITKIKNSDLGYQIKGNICKIFDINNNCFECDISIFLNSYKQKCKFISNKPDQYSILYELIYN